MDMTWQGQAKRQTWRKEDLEAAPDTAGMAKKSTWDQMRADRLRDRKPRSRAA